MTESGYIKKLKELKKSPFTKEYGESLKRFFNKKEREYFPPDDYINKIGCLDLDHYISSMINQFAEIQKRFSPGSDWNILDLGCGVGRIAIPFKEYSRLSGNYYGVDTWEKGIEWCKKNFSDKFRFFCLQSNDNYYFNDKSTGIPNNYKLEAIYGKSIDLVLAVSTFTHLKKNDVCGYLNEISRVLKNGACGYITCFLIDKFFFEFKNQTNHFSDVLEVESGCYYGYSGQDIFAGYTIYNWEKWLADAQLEFVNYELGKWSNKPGSACYQDILIIRKRL